MQLACSKERCCLHRFCILVSCCLMQGHLLARPRLDSGAPLPSVKQGCLPPQGKLVLHDVPLIPLRRGLLQDHCFGQLALSQLHGLGIGLDQRPELLHPSLQGNVQACRLGKHQQERELANFVHESSMECRGPSK